MIQGGDPKGNGTGGPGYKFADEVGSFTVFDKPGLLAMANSGPNTNGSQFFITEGTPTHLNGKHTIFGDCSDLDLVKKIARVETSSRDKPAKDVKIEHIEVTAK
jgi:peptidyl-prolyl cis-trans isomerase A (cyclophilin A)